MLPRAPAGTTRCAVGRELAQVDRRFGSRVTLVDALPRLLAAEAEFIGAAIEAALKADGVDVRSGTSLERVADGRLELDDGSHVDADRLLIAVGAAGRPSLTWT